VGDDRSAATVPALRRRLVALLLVFRMCCRELLATPKAAKE
jgi:hypothetical protein